MQLSSNIKEQCDERNVCPAATITFINAQNINEENVFYSNCILVFFIQITKIFH